MLRKIVRKIIYLLPENMEAMVIQSWRSRKLWTSRLKLKLHTLKSVRRYLSDNTVYWVDPRKIVFTMNSEGFYKDTPLLGNQENPEFNVHEYHGRVLDGDWDGLTRKFSELDFYRSYQERILKGISWEQLPYYKRVLGQIENGINKWGCKTQQDLDKRCAMLDRIFNDIKQNGYKSRDMQRKEQGKNSLFDETDEITVNIGRHGDLIFNNGRHRLTFAKIAGIAKVPVTITVRHSLWEEFKQEIESYACKNNGTLNASLTHIDLQNIPARDSQERFNIIRGNFGEKNITVLDINACWGYLCHRFEEDGFQCTAVENEPENLYFLEKLKKAENRVFGIITEPVLTLGKRGPVKYDVILALDIFHHFIKDEVSYEDLRGFLQRLDVNEMYFSPHLRDESPEEKAYISFSPEESIRFILENSCLHSFKMIGKGKDGGAIYKLWR